MKGINSKSESKGESTRRIAAMVVAIGSHLVLMMVLLRPGAVPLERFPVSENDTTALKLRFRRVQRRRQCRLQALREGVWGRLRACGGSRRTPHPQSLIMQRPRPTLNLKLIPRRQRFNSIPAAPSNPSFTDGGFRQRLLDAQNFTDVHGVPGSDLRLAPGIQLIDPVKQGVGACHAPRATSVRYPSRHCMDVDTWKTLTPVELIARHLTARDVEEANQKYQCNRPLGLSI